MNKGAAVYCRFFYSIASITSNSDLWHSNDYKNYQCRVKLKYFGLRI